MDPAAATADAKTAFMPYAVLVACCEFLRADAACAHAMEYAHALETARATSSVAPMYAYIQCAEERYLAKEALARAVRDNAPLIHAAADAMLVADADAGTGTGTATDA